MTDRIQELLDHTADGLTAGAVTPEPPAVRDRPSWLTPVAAAAATAVIALAAAGIVDAATGGVAPQESPSYGRRTLECPSQFALPHPQGAPEQPTLAAAPADSTAVLLCAQNVAPGSASHLRLQPEPLTSVTDQDGVRRLVLALQSAPELGNTRACGIRAPFRVLVFLHPGGQQAYSVQLTKSCSFISDGSTHRSVPQEVAALIPADGEAAEERPQAQQQRGW